MKAFGGRSSALLKGFGWNEALGRNDREISEILRKFKFESYIFKTMKKVN